jgi:hypothetical protein
METLTSGCIVANVSKNILTFFKRSCMPMMVEFISSIIEPCERSEMNRASFDTHIIRFIFSFEL